MKERNSRRGEAPSRSSSSGPREPLYISVQSRGVFALPAEIRKRHHLDEPGAQLRVLERDDGVIELHPQLAIPADQAWFWTERWQAMERAADADTNAGRLTSHRSDEAFLEHIDSLREPN